MSKLLCRLRFLEDDAFISLFQQLPKVSPRDGELVRQCSARVRFPHLRHRRWSSRSRRWPSLCLYVSLPSSFVAVPRPDRHCSYESSGSTLDQLTFSEHMGKSYKSDVSEKFIEYLRVCCRASQSICTYLLPLTCYLSLQQKKIGSFTPSNLSRP